jgi:hypothetical protein
LWLNPLVDIVGNGSTVQWSLSSDGSTMDVQYVSVGQLKNPSTIPAGVLSRFAAYGITSADYATMLGRDPYASGTPSVDTSRYALTWTTLPYEPPLAAGDAPASTTLTITNETTTTHTDSVSEEYSVAFSFKTGGDFTSWLSGSLSSTTTFTWDDAEEYTSSSTSTQSASVTITGPSFGYTGPTDMGVYYDRLYGTFMFAPITGTLSLSGVVSDGFGAPIANTEVIVSTSSGPLRTFTGPRGDYRIYGASAGSATVQVDGVASNVTLGSAAVEQNIVVGSQTITR